MGTKIRFPKSIGQTWGLGSKHEKYQQNLWDNYHSLLLNVNMTWQQFWQRNISLFSTFHHAPIICGVINTQKVYNVTENENRISDKM